MKAAGNVRGGATPAVAVVDDAGTVIGWTQAAEELTGYPAADILGRPIGSLCSLDGHDRDGERAYLPRTGLMEVRRRDGEVVIVRAEAAPLTLDDDAGAQQEFWLVLAIPATIDPSTGTGALLESLISSFPVAMAIWDRNLRCVWMNEAAEKLSDGYPYYRVGRSLTEVIEGIDTEAMQDAMRKVLADGRPVIDREARWSHGSQERELSISLLPLEGADGRPLGVCSVALDFSNSQARDHLDLLREASVRLGSTLDVTKTAQELAELAIPVLADHVTIDLPEAMLPGEEPLPRPAAAESGIPVFRRAGVASVHDGTPQSSWERQETVFVPPGSPFMEVLRSRRPHFEPVLDTSPGTWLDLDPDRARTVHATGMHSLIVIPLQARGDVLGVAVFGRTSNPAPFIRDDLLLAEELVTRAALSLDNARRYTRERLTALALQRDLLPHDLCGTGTVEVASRYLPSGTHEGVGGDWYDAIHLPGARIALVVGDVTGHGINAAATMGRLRTAVRTLEETLGEAAELVGEPVETAGIGVAGAVPVRPPVLGVVTVPPWQPGMKAVMLPRAYRTRWRSSSGSACSNTKGSVTGWAARCSIWDRSCLAGTTSARPRCRSCRTCSKAPARPSTSASATTVTSCTSNASTVTTPSPCRPGSAAGCRSPAPRSARPCSRSPGPRWRTRSSPIRCRG
nr:PAS domain-containing protein [Nonomuraea terrae]